VFDHCANDKKEKKRTLVLKQIGSLLVSLLRKEKREKSVARTYKNCERFMLIVLFTLSASCSACYRSSNNFILLNDDYHPHSTIYYEIHWELPSSSVFFSREQSEGWEKPPPQTIVVVRSLSRRKRNEEKNTKRSRIRNIGCFWSLTHTWTLE
jgi:hypothetical protein